MEVGPEEMGRTLSSARLPRLCLEPPLRGIDARTCEPASMAATPDPLVLRELRTFNLQMELSRQLRGNGSRDECGMPETASETRSIRIPT